MKNKIKNTKVKRRRKLIYCDLNIDISITSRSYILQKKEKTVTPDDNFEFRPGRLTQLQSNKNKISKQKTLHV